MQDKDWEQFFRLVSKIVESYLPDAKKCMEEMQELACDFNCVTDWECLCAWCYSSCEGTYE
jgi:hypothetical protein